MYDIAIIGAGPAGLTSAIYAARADKKVVVIEKETFGGQITKSPKVENYPGFIEMSGNEFAEKLIEQTSALGVDIELDTVKNVAKGNGFFTVECEYQSFEAKSVIIAAGSKHRTLGIEREEELTGKGVSYCAVCDGPFFKGQDIAVIGGGNSALQEIVKLSEYCKSVTAVQNLDFLTGEKKLQRIIEQKDNVRVICGATVDSLVGDDTLTGVVINKKDGSKETLAVTGMFVAIGQCPENEPFKNVAELDERGFIISGEDCCTKTPGVYVAGDCRTKSIRQIVTATGDGATAAVCACRFCEE